MVVTTAMDEMVETPLVCENCTLSVDGRTFQIDLICLPLKKIDVVLGMIGFLLIQCLLVVRKS